MDTPLPPSLSAEQLVAALQARSRHRLNALSDANLTDLLADTVFHERKRIEREPEGPAYALLLDQAAHALRETRRGEMEAATLGLVAYYTSEIHTTFSKRAYRVATQILPGGLTRLLSASSGKDLLLGNFDPQSRIRVDGPLPMLRAMVERGTTLIVAPTHVSNLDSPLIGYALYAAGLPPCAYGAGLNLFSNPVMSFFMRRLGTYTVDRRKRNQLYKDTLKDYSTEIIRQGRHSLFFPGGTRSRSGRLESRVKKGLLGTGLLAWEENLKQGQARDVVIVPCTLSIGVVLEAESLVADALAEEGKQRYIISDDEFSKPKEVASFGRRLMQLDCRVHVVFGAPMDPLGNPVNAEGQSLDPHGQVMDRRAYVCDRAGKVVFDEQRDQIYTERMAQALSRAWRKGLVIQPTHLAAWAAWRALCERHPGLDVYRLIRLHPEDRVVSRERVLALMQSALQQFQDQRKDCPASVEATLAEAIRLFQNFHKQRAIEAVPGGLRLSGELTWYYHNRLEAFKLLERP